MKKQWQKIVPKLAGIGLNIAGYLAPRKTVAFSMQLFSRPRKGRIASHQAKFLQKAKQSQFQYRDKKYQVYEFGNAGIPVLIAHGWESNSWRWRKLMRHAEDANFRFIALDAPGHGMTPSPYFNVKEYGDVILALSAHYDCKTLIGHSIGGFACLWAAASPQAGHIEKVISLAAPSSLKLIMEKYFAIVGLSGYLQRKTFEYFPAMYGMQVEDLDIARFGHKIRSAGLIVHDRFDNINGPESAYEIKRYWNSGALMITDYSDHSLQHEEVFQKIKSVLTSVDKLD